MTTAAVAHSTAASPSISGASTITMLLILLIIILLCYVLISVKQLGYPNYENTLFQTP